MAQEGDIVLASMDEGASPDKAKTETSALLKNQWLWLAALVMLGIALWLKLKA